MIVYEFTFENRANLSMDHINVLIEDIIYEESFLQNWNFEWIYTLNVNEDFSIINVTVYDDEFKNQIGD